MRRGLDKYDGLPVRNCSTTTITASVMLSGGSIPYGVLLMVTRVTCAPRNHRRLPLIASGNTHFGSYPTCTCQRVTISFFRARASRYGGRPAVVSTP